MWECSHSGPDIFPFMTNIKDDKTICQIMKDTIFVCMPDYTINNVFSLKVHKEISTALNIFCGIFIFPLTASIQFLLPGNKILMNKIQINTSKAIRKQKKT